MIDGPVFIGAIIIAVVRAIKLLVPQVNGAVTIAVALVVGVAVALLDSHIGVADITVAQGVLTALAASGTVTVARNLTSPE